MHSPRVLCLALAAAFFSAAALPARADSISAAVTFNTSGLTESGPFELYLQLNDGSGTGDGNNTLSLTNFNFGAGGAAGSMDAVNSSGGYSGSLSAGLTLNDSQPFNAVAAFFTPGSQLSFNLTDTFTSLDSPIPDTFAFALIANGVAVSTTATDGSDSLIEFNFDASSATPLVYADNAPGDTAGTPTAQLQNPPATVPEPATLELLALGLALGGLILAGARRKRTL